VNRGVRPLTPDGWQDRRPGQSWPTLNLLVCGPGNHKAWTEDYDARLHDLAQLRNVPVVMPEMPLFGFYSDWFNVGRGVPSTAVGVPDASQRRFGVPDAM
jgi:hypothetical protein